MAGNVIGQPPVKIEHYSTEQGLSHDIISSMYKDTQGYLWLGTFNGINRFDGSHITSFNSGKGNINNKRIDQIVEDQYNHLWIKSYDGQIYRFDKGTDRFTPLSQIIKLKGKVYIERILASVNGMLWLKTLVNGIIVVPDLKSETAGYYTFSKENKANRYLPSDTVNFFFEAGQNFYVGTPKGVVSLLKISPGRYSSNTLSFETITQKNFSAVAEKSGNLFFGTTTGELIIYNRQYRSFRSVKLSNGKVNRLVSGMHSQEVFVTTSLGELIIYNIDNGSSQSSQYPAGGLFAIFEDRRGDLWLEPQKVGVVRFERKSRYFQTFKQKNDATTVAPLNHFRVFEDRHGTVWAVLRDGGFGYYDNTNGKFQYFYNEPGSIERRFSNLVTTAFYDPSGVMFLHTDQRGLEKVIFNPNAFKLQLAVNPGLYKSDNEMRGLLCDRQNRIWAGARSGLLYVYQDNRKVNITFNDIPAGGFGAIYSIFQSRNGNIWLATKEKGLYMLQPTDQQEMKYAVKNFRNNEADRTTISSNQVYAVTEDLNARIWVGTFDRGLNQLHHTNGKYNFERFNEPGSGYPAGFQKIRHMAVDNSGRVWIGSTGGLVVTETKDGNHFKFNAYAQEPGRKNGLSNSDIQYILKDHKGQMWLATSGGGLNLASPAHSGNGITFSTFSTGNGMGNDYVLSCIEDKQHQLWIATKSSLSRLNPATGKFDNFNSYDGVPNDGFSEASAVLTRDGNIGFGTIRGLLFFDPLKIKYHAIRANLVFTNLQVNSEDVNAGSADSILHQNIDNTAKVVLKHNQNIFSIDYAILDFRSADRQRFQYRLVGFDNTWHDNMNRRRATYTNIPPGNYRFEVKSTDPDNYSNIPAKSLNITILPPFWKTWWAYLIYVLLFAAAIEVARRVISTFLHLRQEVAIEHKMTELKMAFFTNVSHELRTPLTLILNPIEEILKKTDLPGDVLDHATIVRKNADRMVHFVNQLLDLRKSQSGQSTLRLSRIEVFPFINGVVAYFTEEAKIRQIRVIIDCETEIIAMLDADKLETVVYNLLSNAFKFSAPGKQIRIIIKSIGNPDLLQIIVSDNGCGVPEADLQRIFQLYHESTSAATHYLKGTGIGLALAKELVELHGGTISAANVAPSGLAVSLQIPLVLLTDNVISDDDNLELITNEVSDSTKPLVLLVEDNIDLKIFLSSMLGKNYKLKTASDGVGGLESAKKHQPDLILSDVMMPNMDGIEMLDQLKNDPATSHIPVILLSAKSDLESQIKGLRYGADYYISKPFSNEHLLTAIASMLDQRKRIVEGVLMGKKMIDLNPGQVIVTSKDEIFLQKVIEIMDERIRDIDFDIEHVANMLNMSRSAFYVKFKSLTQQPPVEFVRDMRLKIAKQLLDGGAGNITEVSYAVGFSSAKYFSTCFKAAYGFSPSEYLKEVKSRKQNPDLA